MKRLSLLLILVTYSGLALSSEVTSGDSWLKFPYDAKKAIVISFDIGVSRAAIASADEAMNTFSPQNEENFEVFLKSDKLDTYQKNYMRIGVAAVSKFGVRHKMSRIIEQIDYIYREPAARDIPWYFVISLAQDRLDGKDITNSINNYIKTKPWDMFVNKRKELYNN